ncbi:hypothetical protein ACFQHW_03685 [Lapidilactobacillus achengensis]|uniref:ABC3 transporter permease protein domain-containing protein n=1 Tax=Lapidilactobacillus achengensis TaxID=2486000 RepID=A0ABW1ULU0_9LACO|nr:hypothetical protein [Lapidilactobacillus achengensis]
MKLASKASSRQRTTVKMRLRLFIKPLLRLSLPQILLFTTLLLVLLGIRQATLTSFREHFTVLAPNAIYLDAQTLKPHEQERLNQRGIEVSTDRNRLFFAQRDYDQVRDLPLVKQALPAETTRYILDANGNELQLSLAKNQLPPVFQRYRSFATAPSQLNFGFQSLQVPPTQLKAYNPQNIQLISGHYPSAANELLVPDFFNAAYDHGDRAARSVQLPVLTAKGQRRMRTYQISGTYRTDHRTSLWAEQQIGPKRVFALYLPYHPEDPLKTLRTQATYQNFRQSFATNQATKDYSQKLVGSYAAYLKSIGIGKTGMLIVTRDAAAVPKVSQQLAKLYPQYLQISRYAQTHGELARTYWLLLLIVVVATLLVMGALLLSLIGSDRHYLRRYQAELASLAGLASYRVQLKKIMTWLLVSQLTIIYLGTQGLLALVQWQVLGRLRLSQYFTQLFTWSDQGLIALIMLTILIVVVCWGRSYLDRVGVSGRVDKEKTS